MCKKCGSNNTFTQPIFINSKACVEKQIVIGVATVCLMCGREIKQEIFKRYENFDENKRGKNAIKLG